ncbi:MAG: hypothetical protein AAF355_10540 [Myxococcota bacterium]
MNHWKRFFSFFTLHWTSGLVAVLCISMAISSLSRIFLLLSGAFFLLAGISAILAQRSMIAPRTAKMILGRARNDVLRRDLERANGLMTGTLLVAFGIILLWIG